MASPTSPLRAGIYARLSRVKATAAKTADAMERQEGDCRELCQQRDWQIVKVYPDEGLSAAPGAKRRPEFERALEDLAAKRIDVLVIWKLDRFYRSLFDLLRIEKVLSESGGQLVSVKDGWLDTTAPQGRFMLRQYALLGEHEIENIRIRVSAWHKQRAGKGLPLVSGRRPFGYVDKQRSAVDREEADVIRECARRLLGRGANRHKRSLHAVVSWVNDDLHLYAPHGKPWHVSNFRQMLLSPGLAGLRTYKAGRVTAATLPQVLSEAVEGTWEPILDQDTWRDVAKLLTDPERTGPGRPPTIHLLSGLVACGKCSTTMRNHHRTDGERQYSCRLRTGTTACGGMAIKAEPLEALVSEMVLEHLAGPGLERARKALAAHDADDAALERELQAAKERRDEIEDMYEVGDLNRPAFLRMHAPAEEQVAKLAGLLASHQRGQVLASLPDTPEELADWWTDPATSVEERREVLRSLVSTVLIGPSGPRMSRFDPARLAPPYGPQWLA
jgi:site-specific DNA recombinase